VTRVRFGGDYNPEQHPESMWAEDVRLMREARVDLVNVAVFAWSRIQPAEGEFDFGWLDRIVDMLWDAGISVGMGTATASPPPWAVARYPEILPRNADGVVLGPGSRQHYAASSPVFQRLVRELSSAVAARYAQHPAVALWHVSNEYAIHTSVDYSDAAAAGFREWLAARYGDLDELNRAWSTTFWSQRYTAWEQVLPPRRAPYTLNPAQLLDFRRFSSDALLGLFTMERDIIRATGAMQPITTNLIGPWATQDLWRWAAEMDLISDDCYPDPDDPEAFREAALHGDLMRGLAGGRPWLRMEGAPNSVNWRWSNAPAAPGQVAALAWQAHARGADGIQFFQWRQSPGGAEKFHSGMVPHAGTATRAWREIVALGAGLADAPPAAADSHAQVALVLDFDNWWAIEGPDHPATLDYSQLVQRWYRALHARHVSIDIVRAAADLSSYRLVVAPQVYLLEEDGAASLRSVVERGAVLCVGAFSDVVDRDDRFRPGGFLTQLGPVLGVRVEEQAGLQQPGRGAGQTDARFELDGRSIRAETYMEAIHAEDADVLAWFADGRYAGMPALTRRVQGAGQGWYVAAIPDAEGTAALVDALLRTAGVEPELGGLPAHVEVARRGDLLTLINHGPDVTVSIDAADYRTGDRVGTVTLARFEVRHLRAPG
jgi:beta-galactosidase